MSGRTKRPPGTEPVPIALAEARHQSRRDTQLVAENRTNAARPLRARLLVATVLSLIIGALIAVGGLVVVVMLVGGRPLDLLLGSSAPGRAGVLDSRQVTAMPSGMQPTDLVPGPKGGAYFIDGTTASVWRVNTGTGKTFEIIRPGDRADGLEVAIGEPRQLAAAGGEVVIVDDAGRAWRWRPTDRKDAGTLAPLQLGDMASLPAGHGPAAAFDPEVGEYRLYVVDRGGDQVLRFQQTFDGGTFLSPSPYLIRPDPAVDGIDRLHLDFDLYALARGEIQRYRYGRRDFLWIPQDVGGADFRLLAGSGRDTSDGRLYLYDAADRRIVGFTKADGKVLATWSVDEGHDVLEDVRGMYVVEGGLNRKGVRRRDTLVWVTPQAMYEASLKLPGGS
jgi:streptogramin lyase